MSSSTTFDPDFRTSLGIKEAAAMARSVVFLDFDGVIRVAVSTDWDGPTAFDFCQKRMEILRKVALITGIRYVVSGDTSQSEGKSRVISHPIWLSYCMKIGRLRLLGIDGMKFRGGSFGTQRSATTRSLTISHHTLMAAPERC